MPFIDSRITVKVTEEKKEILKAKFGKAVNLIGKPESFLMVGIEDNYSLYFAGDKLEKGAYIAVSLYGSASEGDYEKMTSAICEILEDELEIPGNHVYVTFHSCNDWGWNGELL